MKTTIKWAILIALISVVAYFNRWIFAFKYEPEYWENYYYTSQWNIPNSERVISDDGLYKFVGYRLVNGENTFNINYWIPPMGKYWYGVGAKYLHNPYLISFIFYLCSIFVFALLSKILFKKENIRWLSLYLWVINPLLVEQVWQTMLDLPMVLFFLTHIYFLFKFETKKSIKNLAISAIFLGLTAGTKPAYFIPMIGLIDWWWILTVEKNNRLKNIFLFLFFVIGGYVLSYTCYFIAHPNPIPWLRLHQKVIDFQIVNSGGGNHDVLNIFRTIFFGKFKGFWVGGQEMIVKNWSLILPLGSILLLKNLLFFKKTLNQNRHFLYLSLIGLGYILMCLKIEFWPRYLLLVLPILLLLVIKFFEKTPLILILILISYLPWLNYNFFPNQKEVIEEWNQNINAKHYREAYRLLDKSTQQKINETDWLKSWQNNKSDNLIKEVVLENNRWRIILKDLNLN